MHSILKAGGNSWNTVYFRLLVHTIDKPCKIIFCSIAILFSVAAVSIPANCYSGNRWMLDQNRQELLMLNSELLQQLSSIIKNGVITLNGTVVYRDGKTIPKIHKLQDFSSASDENRDNHVLFKEAEDYTIFLREETLAEIPIAQEATPGQRPGIETK